ncbi:hypothetical protein [Saccharopolyspora sp. NPDC049426]|uniref:MFS transporter n=1 Tax=Saccharopolyspora sp. NPDC049426 TaxID=3155652 RepID=UPI0034464F1B
MLTAAPPLCIAAAALALPAFHTRLSIGRLLAISAGMQAVGLALRALGSTTTLLVGSALAYLGMAVAGIALPVHIHTYYPRHAARIIAAVAATISAGVATANATTPPLLHAAHGHPAIPLLLPFPAALIAWALWTVCRPAESPTRTPVARGTWRWMLRNPRTWALIVFFALQSGLAIAMLSWEAALFRAAGIPAGQAGLLVAGTMAVSIATALTLGTRTNRATSQAPGLVTMTSAGIAGVAGFLLAPTTAPWGWAALLGVGVAVLSVALALPSLRTTSPQDGIVLGSIVQGAGYLLAAAGPLAVSLTTPTTGLILLIAGGLAQLALVGIVGRPHHIEHPAHRHRPADTAGVRPHRHGENTPRPYRRCAHVNLTGLTDEQQLQAVTETLRVTPEKAAEILSLIHTPPDEQ